MEPNVNETPTNHTPGQSAASGSGAAPLSGSGFGASAGSSSSGSTSSGNFADSAPGSSGIADRAKGAISGAREKVGSAKDALADKLEAGAERLQQRSQGGQLAGAGESSMTIGNEGRLAGVTSSVASGMQDTADWLREADLESLKEGVEQQVKEHPGRTLLIALGVGYLLGKAFRR
jgi:hypothetical protein